MDQLLNTLVSVFGLEGTTLLAVLAVLSVACRLIGKAIPDDATGFLAIVRKVTKVLGLYISNRLTSNVSTNDAARSMVGIPPK
jgi:hypothetical protein